MKRIYILSSIVVAIAVVLGVSEVRAADFPAEPLTAPRECNIGGVRIVAGPDADGNPAAVFPRVVTCPDPVDCLNSDTWDPPLIGQYLIWEYRFTYIDNLDHALLSVSSDVEIAQMVPAGAISDPAGGDSMTGLGEDMWESRILRYNANATVYLARYYTELGIVPRVATAGYRSGRRDVGYCLLAGAGTEAFEAGQAVAETECFVLPGTPCTVCYMVDSRGRVLPGSMIVVNGEGDCQVEETTVAVTIDGVPIQYLSVAQWTTGESCK